MRPALSARHAPVGRLLRQYRENLGYDLGDVAEVLECDRSKISRIETGQRNIRPRELRELLTEYGMDAATQATLTALTGSRGPGGWWSDYSQILRGGYLDFVIAKGVATHLWVYAPLQVPDLLRTKAYAKSVTAADPTIPKDSQYLAVEATIARQAAILHKRRTDCTVVLGEATLRQQASDTDVHRQQLTCLADLSTKCPWLTIRILPFTADAHAAGSGGFSVLRFKETPALGLVHVSGPAGGICLDDDAATSSYIKVFTELSRFTLSPEQSAEQFRRLAAR
jgi:transcriptional regulator with XRE-family HTH domain